jgi:hypothetical protein
MKVIHQTGKIYMSKTNPLPEHLLRLQNKGFLQKAFCFFIGLFNLTPDSGYLIYLDGWFTLGGIVQDWILTAIAMIIVGLSLIVGLGLLMWAFS